MKKLVFFAAIMAVSVSAVFAQSSDYKKWEFFGGYSTMGFDNLGGDISNNTALNEILKDKQNLRGFDTSITANFHRYVGVKGSWSLHLREDNFTRPQGSGTIDTTVQNFLGGIQIKDNATDSRFKPFAHAMIGVANQKIDIDSPQMQAVFGVNDISVNETSFAQSYGGGIDIRASDRIDIRVIQFDYNVINRGEQRFTGPTINPPPPGTPIVVPGTRQDNFKFSFGIVIH